MLWLLIHSTKLLTAVDRCYKLEAGKLAKTKSTLHVQN